MSQITSGGLGGGQLRSLGGWGLGLLGSLWCLDSSSSNGNGNWGGNRDNNGDKDWDSNWNKGSRGGWGSGLGGGNSGHGNKGNNGLEHLDSVNVGFVVEKGFVS